MHRLYGIVLLLSLSVSLTAAQSGNSSSSAASGPKDAILQAGLRILGPEVVPFTSTKQNAVIVGVVNVLGNGVGLSDIQLTVLQTYDNVTAYGNRRLLQSNSFPGVDTMLRISTYSSVANSQATALSQGANVTYSLASAIGAQGLQTQQIVLQSTAVQANQPAVSPPTGSSPPPASPPARSVPVPSTSTTLVVSPPPQSMTPAASPLQASPPPAPVSPPPVATAQAPSPLDSGSAASNAANSKSSGSSLSGGAIAGIAVGGAVVLALLGLLAFFTFRRRRTHLDDNLPEYETQGSKGAQDRGSSNIVAYGSNYRPAPVPAGMSHARSDAARVDDKTEHGLSTEKIEVH